MAVTPRSGLEVAEDGEYPAVVGVRRGQAKFAEDVPDVLFDGPLRHHQDPSDRGVGAALGHQREYLAFPGGECAEAFVAAAGPQKLRDDLGVQGGTPGGHPAERFDELLDVADAVLEQVPDTGGASFPRINTSSDESNTWISKLIR